METSVPHLYLFRPLRRRLRPLHRRRSREEFLVVLDTGPMP